MNPLSESELNIIINEPWEISDNPTFLFTSFAIYGLLDLVKEDDEDGIDKLWGSSIPDKILVRQLEDLISDFNDAARNRKTIRIQDKTYSIRKRLAYNPDILHRVFSFKKDGSNFIVEKSGIMNLLGEPTPGLKPHTVTTDQFQQNRLFLRKVIKLAEDDANDGWDKLTDMEMVVYCWALFYNKHQYNNLMHFLKDYKDNIYVTEADIKSCFNPQAALRESPVGMYTFSKEKVLDWNIKHNQISVVDDIPDQEAEDYWYEIALNNSFKPIDSK